jgi:pyrrolidone-carboxylate peptidase
MGLARGGFRIERRARRPIALAKPEGEAELQGHWPWEEMSAELMRAGVDAKDSWDAGQYVCESTYWSLLDFRVNTGFPEFAGFLHVAPCSDVMPLERIAQAVGAVVDARLGKLGGSD